MFSNDPFQTCHKHVRRKHFSCCFVTNYNSVILLLGYYQRYLEIISELVRLLLLLLLLWFCFCLFVCLFCLFVCFLFFNLLLCFFYDFFFFWGGFGGALKRNMCANFRETKMLDFDRKIGITVLPPIELGLPLTSPDYLMANMPSHTLLLNFGTVSPLLSVILLV